MEISGLYQPSGAAHESGATVKNRSSSVSTSREACSEQVHEQQAAPWLWQVSFRDNEAQVLLVDGRPMGLLALLEEVRQELMKKPTSKC